MPDLHTQQCADTTSNDSECQQSGLWYTPAALLGFQFINAIDKEGQDIDANEDIYYRLCHTLNTICNLFRSFGIVDT